MKINIVYLYYDIKLHYIKFTLHEILLFKIDF